MVKNITNISNENDLQQIYLDIFEYFIKLNYEIKFRDGTFNRYIEAMAPLIKKVYTNSERIEFCKKITTLWGYYYQKKKH